MNSQTIILIVAVFGVAGFGYWYWSKNQAVYSPHSGIRLFTASQCNALNGTHHQSGECTKKEGGSFSWEMRDKNFKI